MKPHQFNFLLLFTVSFLWPHSAGASPEKVLSGQITDEKGQPVPYTEVYLPESKSGTTSDRDGRFWLTYDSSKEGRLEMLHAAYETVKIDLDTLTSQTLRVALKSRTYHFDPIVVQGNLYGRGSLSLPVTHRVVPLARSPDWGNSVGERLDKSGIQINDYGGPAGLKTAASPTGRGEHILIMFDGLPLNSPQHGGFDFTTLPADILTQAEYYSGHGSSLYGSNAVGGTLNLIPVNQRPLAVRLKSGSFGESGISGSVPLKFGSLNASFFGSGFRSTGEFPYTPPGEAPGQTQIRKNNDFDQALLAAGVSQPLGKQWKAAYFGLESRSTRGITGSLQFPSDSARKNNEDQIHSFTVRGLSGFGTSEIHLGLINSHEHYRDPDWLVDSKHALSSRIFRVVQRFPHRSVFQNSLILEVRNHSIKSDDAGTHKTTQGAVGGLSQVRLRDDLQISATLRGELSGTRKLPVTTGGLGVLWKPPVPGVTSITANAGNSYRNPTFNDLYWVDASGFSEGNPELRSERGRSANLALETAVPFITALTFEVAGYHFLTWDLIQWTPDENFIFSPENIDTTESYGATVVARYSSPTVPFMFDWTTNLNVSRVLSGPDRYDELLYVPGVSHWIEAKYVFKGIRISVDYRVYGRRRYSHFDDASGDPPFLEPYRRLDASVTLTGPRIGRIDSRLALGVRNLEDRKDQQSVFGYPEPGRALFARLGITRFKE